MTLDFNYVSLYLAQMDFFSFYSFHTHRDQLKMGDTKHGNVSRDRETTSFTKY